jgi:uncharacterized protein YcbX
VAGVVTALRRYPVKSMLGEDLDSVAITAAGLEGDRFAAVIDVETGMVATAKRPKYWRGLLAFAARWNDGAPRITLPDGTSMALDDAAVDKMLSTLLEREVRVSTVRPEHATIGRSVPEEVIAAGDDVDVEYVTIEIGEGTPGTTFVDYAPVHLFTTATLAHVGAELVRYRPNVVLNLPGSEPYAENDWTDRELTIGSVTLRILNPTPRCAIPTLAHGSLPRRTDAVRTLMQQNRVADVGMQPCLGVYAEVVRAGTISIGDTADFDPRAESNSG